MTKPNGTYVLKKLSVCVWKGKGWAKKGEDEYLSSNRENIVRLTNQSVYGKNIFEPITSDTTVIPGLTSMQPKPCTSKSQWNAQNARGSGDRLSLRQIKHRGNWIVVPGRWRTPTRVLNLNPAPKHRSCLKNISQTIELLINDLIENRAISPILASPFYI